MSLLSHLPWGWLAGGGGLLVVGALVALNPVLALKLLRSIGGLLLGALRGSIEWLRKPGHWIKALCAVLAMWAGIASITAYQARQHVIVVVQRCEADKGALQLQITAREMTIAQKDQALTAIQETLEAEAAKLRDLQARNAGLKAETAAAQAAAEKSAAAYQREFDNKPATCTAALNAMEAACPSLQDY